MTAKSVDFEAAVRISPAGIILADNTLPNCPTIFVNQAFTAITGYMAEEAIGKNCRFLQGALTDAHGGK